jgi:predicted nucleic acid-binding protein
MLRARVGARSARLFAAALVRGDHRAAYLTARLLERAVEIDERFADLDLGLVDASIMAYAERHDLPILTFDFKHFRATAPATGHWRLVMDESQYARATA